MNDENNPEGKPLFFVQLDGVESRMDEGNQINFLVYWALSRKGT